MATTTIMFLYLGVYAVQSGDLYAHRVWMMRSFALSLGAGSQVFTHIPWFLFPSIRGEIARVIFMSLGWLINIVVAEWLISRKSHKSQQSKVHQNIPTRNITVNKVGGYD